MMDIRRNDYLSLGYMETDFLRGTIFYRRYLFDLRRDFTCVRTL